ncbi:MAG TPA: 4-hydroxythreonine-4-phosphate dehydrogenase PdxA, partial [Rhizomicrobium sp.]
MGEPSGIGPEVAVAAFNHFGGRIGGRAIKLVGDPDIFASHIQALIPTRARVASVPGKPDPANAPAVIEAIETAVKACLAGEAAAMVTAPIHK